MSQQRIDHYFSLERDGEIEEGHIFCTPDEGREIKIALETKLGTKGVLANVEPGGEYDYTTEEAPAAAIAADILRDSGFIDKEDRQLMERANPDRLYWNVSGHITCGEHAPYVGTDTWEWEQWHEVTLDALAEWRRSGYGEPMKCETCGKHDGRETS